MFVCVICCDACFTLYLSASLSGTDAAKARGLARLNLSTIQAQLGRHRIALQTAHAACDELKNAGASTDSIALAQYCCARELHLLLRPKEAQV